MYDRCPPLPNRPLNLAWSHGDLYQKYYSESGGPNMEETITNNDRSGQREEMARVWDKLWRANKSISWPPSQSKIELSG